MTRPVQYFSDEYLKECRRMTPTEIARFVEGFRRVVCEASRPAQSRLISIKMPEDLLELLKQRAQLEGLPYQTFMKQLLRKGLE